MLIKIKRRFLKFRKLLNFDFFIFFKGLKKVDLLIYDDVFPHPVSGFRHEEFSVLLSGFKKSKIILSSKSYPLLKTPISDNKKHVQGLIRTNKKFKRKIVFRTGLININAKLFYCIFINNIYENIEWLEKYKIPFVFTLYPGGGFEMNDVESDFKLRKVFNSEMFRQVIVTQKVTEDYLIKNNFCVAHKIIYVFGGVVPQISLNTGIALKKYYPNKETFDIVFCAAKYMPKGLDKGYDIFVELAHNLIKKYDFVLFHVVGGFDKEEIDVSLLGNKIAFYGYQKFEDLAAIYKKMDVIVSPNKPFLYGKGAFDGFPLGTVIEAVLNGVVAIVTDELNQNTVFENEKEIMIINSDVASIEEMIISFIQNPEKLIAISKNGRKKFLEIYSNDYQMNPRIKLLRDEIEKNKK